MESHNSNEDGFKSSAGKRKFHIDLNKFPDIEDSFEVESETIEHSLDSTTTVEEIVEESDIEGEDEGRQPIIRRKMQIWNEKDAKEITEVNSRDGSHSTSGSLDMIDNLHELNKDAEEELNKDAEEEEPFSLEREAVKDEVMNVLRIYFHRV
ncbi:unnamed protein product [Vicia faba]|uniref:Uncharacterized protein n=1 Tax=Vicia faba TaxID=3906 RepID=A0AAV0ZXX9_VICFA|nr:unnamed protein product [Vicia faba]